MIRMAGKWQKSEKTLSPRDTPPSLPSLPRLAKQRSLLMPPHPTAEWLMTSLRGRYCAV